MESQRMATVDDIQFHGPWFHYSGLQVAALDGKHSAASNLLFLPDSRAGGVQEKTVGLRLRGSHRSAQTSLAGPLGRDSWQRRGSRSGGWRRRRRKMM